MKNVLLKTTAFAALFAGPIYAQPAEYPTPQAALEAMMSAISAGDRQAVLTVFGQEAQDYLSDGDPVEDRNNRLELIELYNEGYRMVPQEDGSVKIAFGEDGWLFPVPLAKTSDTSWAFDNEARRDEVYLREIGYNELDVIELMHCCTCAKDRCETEVCPSCNANASMCSSDRTDQEGVEMGTTWFT